MHAGGIRGKGAACLCELSASCFSCIVKSPAPLIGSADASGPLALQSVAVLAAVLDSPKSTTRPDTLFLNFETRIATSLLQATHPQTSLSRLVSVRYPLEPVFPDICAAPKTRSSTASLTATKIPGLVRLCTTTASRGKVPPNTAWSHASPFALALDPHAHAGVWVFACNLQQGFPTIHDPVTLQST
ncbi:hypothetical protein LZ30DRAFT_685569 [Colletotrichum cereale]|nr:hypothetical protein LZ30DRAFT_685569 [Colletotrichum cereale]